MERQYLNLDAYNKVIEIIKENIKINLYPRIFNDYRSKSINCYGYALAIDHSFYGFSEMVVLVPGNLSDYNLYKTPNIEYRDLYKEHYGFMDHVEKDMIALGLNYRYYESGTVEENEFLLGCYLDLPSDDFHFVRSDIEGFSHKEGWYLPPEKISYILKHEHDFGKYIATLALSKKAK